MNLLIDCAMLVMGGLLAVVALTAALSYIEDAPSGSKSLERRQTEALERIADELEKMNRKPEAEEGR